MRIMFVGDTHGMLSPFRHKAEICARNGINTMFVLGDFGLWPGLDGVRYLDEVNNIAVENNVRIVALPGNHEDHPQWSKWMSLAPKDARGFAYVRSNLLLAPKVHYFKWSNKRFFVLGGAVSIDKSVRTPGVNWWADEEFSQENLESVLKYSGKKIDFVLSHDCSDFTPFRNRLKPDAASRENRKRIDRALAHLKPDYHLHGHMHTRYDWNNYHSYGLRQTAFGDSDMDWNGHYTRTFGLECNNDRDSFVVLDLGSGLIEDEKPRFFWPNELHLLKG